MKTITFIILVIVLMVAFMVSMTKAEDSGVTTCLKRARDMLIEAEPPISDTSMDQWYAMFGKKRYLEMIILRHQATVQWLKDNETLIEEIVELVGPPEMSGVSEVPQFKESEVEGPEV